MAVFPELRHDISHRPTSAVAPDVRCGTFPRSAGTFPADYANDTRVRRFYQHGLQRWDTFSSSLLAENTLRFPLPSTILFSFPSVVNPTTGGETRSKPKPSAIAPLPHSQERLTVRESERERLPPCGANRRFAVARRHSPQKMRGSRTHRHKKVRPVIFPRSPPTPAEGEKRASERLSRTYN